MSADMINIISVIVTTLSIIVTIRYAKKEHKAIMEVQRLHGYIDFKRMEEFSFKYRDGLTAYRKRVTSAKWDEVKKGRDIVGEMEGLLIEFNTFLPMIELERRRQISNVIDEAQKEFAKIRKGDEASRDTNLIQLNKIDRLLNEVIEVKKNCYKDIII